MSGFLVCKGCGGTFFAKRIDRQWCDECRITQAQARGHRYEDRSKGTCQDCGKSVQRRALRCRQCDNKARSAYFLREANPFWKGGFTKADGYVYIRQPRGDGERTHPYRAEHILVWEQANEKPLPKGWVVHHLNGIKDDNRPENLLALPRGEHHKHPFPAIEPYQVRIRELERQLADKNQ